MITSRYVVPIQDSYYRKRCRTARRRRRQLRLARIKKAIVENSIERKVKARRKKYLDVDPFTTYWYKAYVNNPKIGDARFEKVFRNRFRLPIGSYRDILRRISDPDDDWSEDFKRWHNCNAAGKKPKPISLLLLGALRYLGRGWTFDDIEEATGIDDDVHRCFLHRFIKFGSTKLYAKYVIAPASSDEAQNHMKEFLAAGFPGCIGSMDATHIQMHKCPNLWRLAHKGFKMSHTARTYNITVNHRRRIISSTTGHPARWNDKTLVRYDKLAVDMKNGEVLHDLCFELYDYDENGSIVKVKYKGGWLLVDNGYLLWSTTIPPYKRSLDLWEIRWSQWLESMRKDVECAFGIMKGRWRVLKAGITLHGIESADKIWLTCCSLHNLLLDVDGLENGWESNRNASHWLGEAGMYAANDLPEPIRRFHSTREGQVRNLDTSNPGRGSDAPPLEEILEEHVEVESEENNDANDNGYHIVRNMNQSLFREKLVRHFNIAYEKRELVWPKRC